MGPFHETNLISVWITICYKYSTVTLLYNCIDLCMRVNSTHSLSVDWGALWPLSAGPTGKDKWLVGLPILYIYTRETWLPWAS